MSMLKKAHELYGLTVQLNLFYRTDFFYGSDEFTLPYGHVARLLQNRKPETMIFTRITRNKAILASICAHNHVTQEQCDAMNGTMKAVRDPETGMHFKKLGGGPTINLSSINDFQKVYDKRDGDEFIGTGTHEQYFYEDYYAYQPDTEAKLLKMAEVLHGKGYTYITADDIEREIEVL